MVRRAKELNVRLRLSAEVIDANFEAPYVILRNGETVGCDMILCADGLWSPMRTKFLGRMCPPLASGQIVYRLLFRKDAIRDAELKQWVEKRMLNFWYGPDKHVVCYNLRGTELLNLGFVAPGHLPAGVSAQRGSAEDLKAVFKDWDPVLHRFIDEGDMILKWKLCWLDALPTWMTENGKFAMVGDCCHPMTPYLAQGANSSIEDGAVFGYLFGKIRHAGQQLQAMARMFQRVRKSRGDMIQEASLRQQDVIHMHDGPEQERRDAEYRRGRNPIPWYYPKDL